MSLSMNSGLMIIATKRYINPMSHCVRVQVILLTSPCMGSTQRIM